ncbi:uncharacterized protein [Venturia canescens]|uniref:uncharacterized protein n=1 Tax=Venturia canescens TaxID=32260 RepID=UPI001C9C2E86|nr:uncharacterized protein LOC122416256 [Venturia canescens]
MEYLVDVQGFQYHNFIVKELAVAPLNSPDYPLVFLFQPPTPWSEIPARYKGVNLWLERNYHRLRWSAGDVPYDEVENVLRSVLRDASTVYVKGEQKQRWLEQFGFNARDVVDCPSLRTSCKLAAACPHHDSPHCALRNVLLLRIYLHESRPSLGRSLKLCHRGEPLSTADIAQLPKEFIVTFAAYSVDAAWEKLPESLKMDPEVAECRRCREHTMEKLFAPLKREYFKIQKGDSQIKHLTRYTLGKRVEENLSITMNEIRDQLRLLINEGGLVCTTADVWTGGARRFLGVTVSWIEPKTLTRKSAAIACRRFPGTHSFDAIANLLSSIYTSFGLTSESIRATVTDNASNFEKAFRKLGIEELDKVLPEDEVQGEVQSIDTDDINAIEEYSNPEDEIDIEEEFSEECQKILPRHCKCASHTMNLIASTDVPKAIARNDPLKRKHNCVLKKCSLLWKLLRSPKKRETLKTELGIAIQRPVVTRWNSSYDCFKQLLGIKAKLIDKNMEGLTQPFTAGDFNYLEEYVRCSTPLANAIDLLQGDTCYYGILLPTLVSMRYQLNELSNSDDVTFCKPLIKVMIDGINRRFEKLFDFTELNVDAAIAAISHPRFKGRWLAQFNEDQQRLIHRRFVEAVSLETLTEARIPLDENQDDEFQFGPSAETIAEFEPSLSQGEVKAEVTRYLKSKETQLVMLEKFPNIRKTFLKYNTPLPSSAPVERLFSYATMMNMPKFNRISEEHFEQRILAKANHKKKYI